MSWREFVVIKWASPPLKTAGALAIGSANFVAVAEIAATPLLSDNLSSNATATENPLVVGKVEVTEATLGVVVPEVLSLVVFPGKGKTLRSDDEPTNILPKPNYARGGGHYGLYHE